MLALIKKYGNETIGYKFSDFHHGRHIFFYGNVFSDNTKLQIGIKLISVKDSVEPQLTIKDIIGCEQYKIHSIVINDNLEFLDK